MSALEYFKLFPTEPEERSSFNYAMQEIIKETPGWTSVCARECPRKLLYFTRHLIADQESLSDVIQDFVKNVMSRDTYMKYHYLPTLIEIRRGIIIQKYEKIEDRTHHLFRACFCHKEHEYDGKWIMPVGITPSEGIELLDNMICLGADPSKFKFRRIGVDQINLGEYDKHARPLFG